MTTSPVAKSMSTSFVISTAGDPGHLVTTTTSTADRRRENKNLQFEHSGQGKAVRLGPPTGVFLQAAHELHYLSDAAALSLHGFQRRRKYVSRSRGKSGKTSDLIFIPSQLPSSLSSPEMSYKVAGM
jgi:hypothetical protein